MTEQELRALVRSVIAQREGCSTADAASPASWSPAPATFVRDHASHAMFVIPAQGDACLIEPAVPCNHCGYCKSYGH